MAKGKEEEQVAQRWDPERKPTLGGISLYIVFLFCLTLTYTPFFGGGANGELQLLGLLGAGSLAFLMGLSDDVYETKPFLKLFVQLGCGTILILSGTSFELPGPDWLSQCFTIFWVVLMMNSFNMVDNMDGIAAGIALTVLGAAMGRVWFLGGEGVHIWPVLVGMTAGVLAFLRYNVHPSSMFLGDAGTQFLGLLLAFLGISYFWGPEVSGAEWGPRGVLVKVMGLLLVFWASLADTLSVFVLRLLRGRSPLQGGKDHTTHALSYAGWSDRGVNIIYLLWSVVNAGLGFYVIHSDRMSTLGIAATLVYILLTFALFFGNAYRSPKEGRQRLV